METCALTADSTCDLSEDMLKKYSVELIGLKVIIGDKEYTDGIDIKTKEMVELCNNSSIIPKTAGINQLDYFDLFSKYTNKGQKVIHFSLSSDLSTSHNSAVLAAKEINKDKQLVYVIDTRQLSLGSGVLVMKAREMLDCGMKVEEVIDEVKAIIPKICASFCVDTLEYLHKGGRCSSVELLGANLLSIRPHIKMEDGKMSVHKKYRGSMQKVVKKYLQTLLEENDPDFSTGYIGHCECDDEFIKSICKQLKDVGFKEVVVQTVGCVITSHCGKGTIGIGFINK